MIRLFLEEFNQGGFALPAPGLWVEVSDVGTVTLGADLTPYEVKERLDAKAAPGLRKEVGALREALETLHDAVSTLIIGDVAASSAIDAHVDAVNESRKSGPAKAKAEASARAELCARRGWLINELRAKTQERTAADAVLMSGGVSVDTNFSRSLLPDEARELAAVLVHYASEIERRGR